MPRFGDANAIGLAGEYLAGAVVAHKLRWPYRMQPIADLGIDGEIEVLDDHGKSTGKFIKVQCKASESPDGRTRYVKPEHFRYWSDLALPVVVMHPRPLEMKVFWSPLDHARETENTVAFDLARASELGESSRGDLTALSVRREEQFDPFLGLLHRLLDDVWHLEYEFPGDLLHDQNLTRYGKLSRRWELMQKLVEEEPDLLTRRGDAKFRSLQKLVQVIEKKIEMVLSRRP